jgi:hypothetical protein
MRRLIFKSSIILLLYTLVNLYFAVFNWRIFTVKLNVDLGFAVVEIPPFVLLFLAGFLLIAVISWINYNLRLRKMILDLEQGAAIGKLKDKLIDKQFRELLYDENTLTVLSEKLGIREVKSKTEVLSRQITELSQKISEQKPKPEGS